MEALGFTGYTFNDSQCLGGDPYVAMMASASATSTLQLATSVTNPVTRHASVTACAIASVQGETKGRVTLGIGRGDSALAHLGLAPASVSELERYLEQVQGYLRGEAVPFAPDTAGHAGSRGIASLGLVDAPTDSCLEWLRAEIPKVPVMVAATGPRVIGMAARLAEGVNFAVGADPARLAWAIATADAARREAGLDPAGVVLGAYLSVIVDEDIARARGLVSGEVASFARFSSMHGTPVGPATDEQRSVMERLHDSYDMRHHFQHGSPQSAALTDEFIERYAVIGPPSQCIDRLQELADLGIRRFIISSTPGGVDRTVTALYRERFATEVLPHVSTAARSAPRPPADAP